MAWRMKGTEDRKTQSVFSRRVVKEQTMVCVCGERDRANQKAKEIKI